MSHFSTFSFENGKLIVSDPVSGATQWRGLPGGARVADLKLVPGENGAIVLLDYSAQPHGPFQNLLRVDPDGAIVWVAELPTTNADAYVSFDLDRNEVHANSWSGYAVTIDIRSGTVAARSFAK
jgi:hypothetical protein